MPELFAQGDILFEKIKPTKIPDQFLQTVDDGVVIVAEGETSGHAHRLVGNATFYRDDALARDLAANLYVGHVKVEGSGSRLDHDEHDSIDIEPGYYRVRRQRQLDPQEIDAFGD